MTRHDWFPADEALRDHELQALRFLAANGPHQVGVIDDEGKFAAALVFVGLTHKGCVVGDVEPGVGPTYHLTAKGHAAIAAAARQR
jgi:hypothetical protein